MPAKALSEKPPKVVLVLRDLPNQQGQKLGKLDDCGNIYLGHPVNNPACLCIVFSLSSSHNIGIYTNCIVYYRNGIFISSQFIQLVRHG